MIIKVKDLHNYSDGYGKIKGDLIGYLDDPDISEIDTNQYLYYRITHTAANIDKKFTNIQEARHFALEFDKKNMENNNKFHNIDNIVGVREEC
jgi:type IV secretory pathway ATPase VirB11/archaellum biosynthesis ATPase